MVLSVASIAGSEVLATPGLRLDPRHFQLMASIRSFFNGLNEPIPLGDQLVSLNNGPNLPADAYAIETGADGDVPVLYASVAAFSMFAFRAESAIRLETDSGGRVLGLANTVAEVELGSSHIAITRSAVPGICWPGELAPDDTRVIPSGFVIRGT